jgi:D-alanyl-D-alanine carboxypeptidase
VKKAALCLTILLSSATAVTAREPVVVRLVSSSPPIETPLAIIATRYGFVGEYVVSSGQSMTSADTIRGNTPTEPRVWRWASVTKQLIATLIMQQVAAGRITLDKPISAYIPAFKSPNASAITVRQLLRHQSGLPNPDDTAATPDAVPAYDAPGYRGSRDPLTGYCAGPAKGTPGGNWSYNNCDYIVAGALLTAVTGKSWQSLVRERIAKPLGLTSLGAYPTRKVTVLGFVDGQPEPRYDLAAFGAAAALYGTAADLEKFDRALMTGKLLPEAQRAEMWDGRPESGSIALGQWVFTAPLKGCAKPTKIVERRGAIGGVEVRNFILPDNDVVVIAFTNRSGFDFGEVWQGKGFSFDMVSAAACS